MGSLNVGASVTLLTSSSSDDGRDADGGGECNGGGERDLDGGRGFHGEHVHARDVDGDSNGNGNAGIGLRGYNRERDGGQGDDDGDGGAGGDCDGRRVLALTEGTWIGGAYTVVLTTGNWDSSSGNFTFTQGTSTVQLDAAAPTVTQKAGDQFYNLALQQGGTLGSNVVVGNSSTRRGRGGGSFGLGGFTLTVGGNFNLKPGATGATLVSAGSTVVLDGAAGQGLTTNNQGFDNLTLTTGTKTVTVTGSLTLSGNLEVQGEPDTGHEHERAVGGRHD